MSAGTARDLLSGLSSGVTKIIAADANAERLASLKQSLNDPRLETRVFDVNDQAALFALLTDCDVCINGVPTFAGFQMSIFEACLEARRTYVDYGGMGVFTVKQKARHGEWKKAGVTAVVGLGSDPGLSNIICRAVADRLDRVDKINLYWAATKIGPDSPVLVPPYSRINDPGGVCESQSAVSRWPVAGSPGAGRRRDDRIARALGTDDVHPLPAFRAIDGAVLRGHRGEGNS